MVSVPPPTPSNVLIELVKKENIFINLYLLPVTVILSIFFFWLLEWITWLWTTQYAIQLHMLVHFMTIVGSLSLLLLEYDFNETFVYIYECIRGKK